VRAIWAASRLSLPALAKPRSAEAAMSEAALLGALKLAWLDPAGVLDASLAASLAAGADNDAAADALDALIGGGGGAPSAEQVGTIVMRAVLNWWQAQCGGAKALGAADATKPANATLLLAKRGLLLRFMRGDSADKRAAQLGALRAVHALCDGLGYPHELLKNLFILLYTKEVRARKGRG
jgi:hypothetical protein